MSSKNEVDSIDGAAEFSVKLGKFKTPEEQREFVQKHAYALQEALSYAIRTNFRFSEPIRNCQEALDYMYMTTMCSLVDDEEIK